MRGTRGGWGRAGAGGRISDWAEEKEKALSVAAFTSISGALGLPERRFPFRPETAAEAIDITPSVAAIVAWAAVKAERLVARIGGSYRWCDATRRDCVQDLIIRLLDRVLPSYDAGRGVELEKYITKCFVNAIRDRLRKEARDRFKLALLHLHGAVPLAASSSDPLEDAAMLNLADEIVAAPERYLDASDAAFLRLYFDRPGVPFRELAAEMQVRSASAVAQRLRQLKARIVAAVKSQLDEWRG